MPEVRAEKYVIPIANWLLSTQYSSWPVFYVICLIRHESLPPWMNTVNHKVISRYISQCFCQVLKNMFDYPRPFYPPFSSNFPTKETLNCMDYAAQTRFLIYLHWPRDYGIYTIVGWCSNNNLYTNQMWIFNKLYFLIYELLYMNSSCLFVLNDQLTIRDYFSPL